VPIPDEAPFTAYTGNLSFETTEADLTDFFSSIGCEQVRSLSRCLRRLIARQITSVRLVMDRDTGKFKGFAYVEFGLLDDLKKALSQTGNSIGGRPIRVSVAESRSSRR
jgi:translation initiation factor 4B